MKRKLNRTEESLIRAAANKKLKEVESYIAAGVDVNASGPNGHTALYQAAKEGHFKIVKSLIAAGANVNITSSNGIPILHWAARSGRDDIAKALIEAGAKTIQIDHIDEEMLSLLQAQERVHKFVGGNLGAIEPDNIKEFNVIKCIKNIKKGDDFQEFLKSLSSSENSIAREIGKVFFELSPNATAKTLLLMKKNARDTFAKLPKEILEEIFTCEYGIKFNAKSIKDFDYSAEAYEKLCHRIFPDTTQVVEIVGEGVLEHS